MLEADYTMLKLHDLLKTLGYAGKFADWMCKDPSNREIFRADDLIEEVLEARHMVIKKLGVKRLRKRRTLIRKKEKDG